MCTAVQHFVPLIVYSNRSLWDCETISFLLGITSCGSLPQQNEHYPISAHHGSSNAHWFGLPSDKSIKMWASNMLASVTSVTTTLASREHSNSESTSSSSAANSASDCQRSPGQPAAAGVFAGLPASPPLAPASPLLQELHLASRWLAITGLLQVRKPTLVMASLLRQELHQVSAGAPTRSHRAAARKNADTSAG
jgi:hypothetical protein